jgi:hypothetical protein
MAASLSSIPLRTCPFQEDQLRAFQRDYRHREPPALRTCPFAAPALPVYQARVSSEFESRRWPNTPGTHVDLWA